MNYLVKPEHRGEDQNYSFPMTQNLPPNYQTISHGLSEITYDSNERDEDAQEPWLDMDMDSAHWTTWIANDQGSTDGEHGDSEGNSGEDSDDEMRVHRRTNGEDQDGEVPRSGLRLLQEPPNNGGSEESPRWTDGDPSGDFSWDTEGEHGVLHEDRVPGAWGWSMDNRGGRITRSGLASGHFRPDDLRSGAYIQGMLDGTSSGNDEVPQWSESLQGGTSTEADTPTQGESFIWEDGIREEFSRTPGSERVRGPEDNWIAGYFGARTHGILDRHDAIEEGRQIVAGGIRRTAERDTGGLIGRSNSLSSLTEDAGYVSTQDGREE